MWNPPGPGIKPMSPALAGKSLTIGPPGNPKSSRISKKNQWQNEKDKHILANFCQIKYTGLEVKKKKKRFLKMFRLQLKNSVYFGQANWKFCDLSNWNI